jgi:hypothetical protein
MAATQTLLNGRPKAYKVLGDIDDYVADVSQAVSLEQSQELLPLEQTLTVSTADLNEFPEDVWQAATHCPDEGLAVLRSYKDVERIRYLLATCVPSVRNCSNCLPQHKIKGALYMGLLFQGDVSPAA